MLYMVQNDIHAPATTVYEALEFSAQMRVRDLDKEKLKDFVDQVGSHFRLCRRLVLAAYCSDCLHVHCLIQCLHVGSCLIAQQHSSHKLRLLNTSLSTSQLKCCACWQPRST